MLWLVFLAGLIKGIYKMVAFVWFIYIELASFTQALTPHYSFVFMVLCPNRKSPLFHMQRLCQLIRIYKCPISPSELIRLIFPATLGCRIWADSEWSVRSEGNFLQSHGSAWWAVRSNVGWSSVKSLAADIPKKAETSRGKRITSRTARHCLCTWAETKQEINAFSPL